MSLDPDACYRAVTSRDPRFDGLFFVGVTTTGIYCRPVCTARTPGRDRCVFFRVAAEAERDGFRACLRCRPDRAPGDSSVDARPRLLRAALAHLDSGEFDGAKIEPLAEALGVSPRHLRRAFVAELGVAPKELVQSRRLALARQLVEDTSLPITNVAFDSGFGSLRSFNAAFRDRFGRSPTDARSARRVVSSARANAHVESIVLSLEYRPPFEWSAMLAFLAARATPGVERVIGDRYVRGARVGPHLGWIAVEPWKGRNALRVETSISLVRVLPKVVARLRRVFDLDARPDRVSRALRADPALTPLVRRRPGLRVPGSFDPFETTARAILGQQVSVAAATTLAGRLAALLGEAIDVPELGISRLTPTASAIAHAPLEALVGIGLVRTRAAALRTFAAELDAGRLTLANGTDPAPTVSALCALPGIGPWTAHYVAMRVLGDPDALPEGDLGLRRALNVASAAEVRARAEAWRPWRAYGAMHLWSSDASLESVTKGGR